MPPYLLSDARLAAAYLVFTASYLVFALGRFPWMTIDRPGAAIIGAVLMVAFRVVDAPTALASIDFATIVLLFSMMLIVANLRLGGFFDWVTDAAIARLHPRHLLPTVVFTTGVLSAFLVNDIVCLVMTPFVLHIAGRLRRPPVPYVLAVALAANAGSTATVTGNPQNMLIGSASGISYLRFLQALGPVALAGLLVTWATLHFLYLRGGADDVVVAGAARKRPRGEVQVKPILVLVAVLAGFLAGAPAALVAAVGAAALLITRTVDPRRVYGDVDWGLLIFFVGLFVIVGGAERAGLTRALLQPIAAWNLHRLALFVPATALLSNVVSNVPAVMLLRTVVTQFPDPHTGWIALAMASTLAGNLTITGSIANIIVVERASAAGVPIGYGEYARAGVPVTVATLFLGSLWLWAAGSLVR